MKKGQIIEGVVERVDFPNKGVVKAEDGTCIVKNALPGQKVKAGINKVRKGKAEGRLLEVLEKSSLETESPCPHFGMCGGCTYISLPYEEQLKVKEGQVKKLLDSVLCKQETPWTFEGIKASPVQFGYRNKMEFSFGDEVKDGPLALGMHKRGSFYDIVTVTDCQIVDKDYREILTFTRDYFEKEKVSFYHKLRHEGYLRHLLVRKAARTGEILVALVTTSQEERDLTPWMEGLLALELTGKFAGILHITNDSLADVVKSDKTEILYGQDFFYEELLGLKFKISTFSFFQTNSLSAEVLYETAREYVGDLNRKEELTDGKADPAGVQEQAEKTDPAGVQGQAEKADLTGAREQAEKVAVPDKVVFDLYSGTGTIAQLMAPVAKKVIGVEIVEEAVEAAKKNAELNGLHNCEFIAGDVLKVLDTIEEKPDMIILDPPRDGIHPKALTKIIGYGIEKLVYISCKPTSLTRDLEVFLENGYVVEKAVAVDQFPWTTGIETVAILKKCDNQDKANDVIEEKKVNYREEEIPDCGCIYG